ncbi:MAG: hypothetical protein FJ290_23075 [Planctomycetes bacterium]|nr:hypothetical protein [Planctomycetota bacterium]
MAETTCRGVVRGSTIVMERDANLREGTEVLITPIGRRKAAPRDLLDVLNASPPVTREDVDELLRLIKEGKRPVRHGDGEV